MKYAILSDIHSNGDALDAVLAVCNDLLVDKYLCLGDVIGYNAEPDFCLEVIRQLEPVAIVKGNHDEYVSNGDSEMMGFNQHAKQAILWTRSQLTAEQLAWLRDLPLRASVPGLNMTLVHATLDTPGNWGYVFDVHHATDNFMYQFTQTCFCGHSHVPVAFQKKPITKMSEKSVENIDEWLTSDGKSADFHEIGVFPVVLQNGYKYLFNIGSVGQPRNRDPRASFAVYDNVTRTVTRYAVPYNVEAAQAKDLEVGLPLRLAERLARGN